MPPRQGERIIFPFRRIYENMKNLCQLLTLKVEISIKCGAICFNIERNPELHGDP
jgi:hypothetical protein